MKRHIFFIGTLCNGGAERVVSILASQMARQGITVEILTYYDREDLIRQVERFLALSWEERKNMGLAGRAKVEKEFDRQIVIDQYLQEVQRIQA